MRAAFLCGYPFQGHRLGVAEHVYQLSQALARAQVETHVVSMHSQDRTWRIQPNLWSHTVGRRACHYLWPKLAAEQLKAVIQRIQPDVIHLHGTMLPYTWAALDLSQQYLTMATIHGDVCEEATYKPFFPRLWAWILASSLQRRVLRQLHTIVICSQAMELRLKPWMFNEAYVIPNGIDLDAYDVDDSAEIGPASYILFLGALKTLKGPDLLIQALPLIIEQVGPISVYFAGSGPEQKKLEHLARQAGLEHLVRFLGFISGEQKKALIQQAEMIVLPSRYEPFGIVLLEAMACGKAVVAARAGGIPEVVRDRETGRLFEPNSVPQLASAVVELVMNPALRKQYGHTGRRVAETYSWSVIARQTISVYQDSLVHYQGRRSF